MSLYDTKPIDKSLFLSDSYNNIIKKNDSDLYRPERPERTKKTYVKPTLNKELTRNNIDD